MSPARRQPAHAPSSEASILERGTSAFVRQVDVTGVGDMESVGFERTVVRSFEATARVLTALSGADTAFRESPIFRSSGLGFDCLDEAARVASRDLAEFADMIAARRMVVHVWMSVGERLLDVVRTGGREQFFEVPIDWRVVRPDGSVERPAMRFFNGAVWTTGAGIGRGDQLCRLLASVLPVDDADRAEGRLASFFDHLRGIEAKLAA